MAITELSLPDGCAFVSFQEFRDNLEGNGKQQRLIASLKEARQEQTP
jgi:hypothetical protein